MANSAKYTCILLIGSSLKLGPSFVSKGSYDGKMNTFQSFDVSKVVFSLLRINVFYKLEVKS